MKITERNRFWNRLRAVLFAVLLAPVAIAACSSAPQASPLQLNQGRYTPLGGVAKSTQPTASDLADMQAAETGTLNQPALIEFYADN